MPVSAPKILLSRLIRSLVLAGWILFPGAATYAVTIDFDDLDPYSYLHDGDLSPLTDEYLSLGVVFESSAYLVDESWGFQPAYSSPNFVAGPGFGFRFVGVFPTHVSMYVGSGSGSRVWVDAVGPGGYKETWLTDGELHGMMVDESDSTPYRPNQFVFFDSAWGISSIGLSSQGDTTIDSLTFTNSSSVAEPHAAMLLALGLTGLAWQRRRNSSRG